MTRKQLYSLALTIREDNLADGFEQPSIVDLATMTVEELLDFVTTDLHVEDGIVVRFFKQRMIAAFVNAIVRLDEDHKVFEVMMFGALEEMRDATDRRRPIQLFGVAFRLYVGLGKISGAVLGQEYEWSTEDTFKFLVEQNMLNALHTAYETYLGES